MQGKGKGKGMGGKGAREKQLEEKMYLVSGKENGNNESEVKGNKRRQGNRREQKSEGKLV